MEKLRESIYSYLVKYPPSLELYKKLEDAGDLYLIGGILREYKDSGIIQNLRDIDIVINILSDNLWQGILQQYKPVRNAFGGFKLVCTGLIIDIWPLEETWAYREKIIACEPQEYVKNLPKTVFLNLDSIIYDFKNDMWYDEDYCEAMKSNMIDVILEQNPQILLNIIRALVLKKRYKMNFSEHLIHIILKEREQNEDFVNRLLKIQRDRYKKEILSGKEIEDELQSICS